LKQLSLDLFKPECAGLKKHDSFSKWMSKELPQVVDLDMKSNCDAFWSVADGSIMPTEQLDAYAVSPSLSPNQLFSILDVSPSCMYIGQKTKVCKLINLPTYCYSLNSGIFTMIILL
jgi:hypothetical protein